MKALRSVCTLIVVLLRIGLVYSHQPVFLDEEDATPAQGPLLKDGTVSFAVFGYVPSGESRGFRAAFKEGDRLEFQVLIPATEPESGYTRRELPTAYLTLPSNKKITVSPSERTYFYERHGGREYYYIARYTGKAEAGITDVLVRAKSPASVVLAIGYREVEGDVEE